MSGTSENKEGNMAPRENDSEDKSKATHPEPVEDIAEDLREIESVSNNLDSLNSALDFIEQRNDDIRAQLLELLSSSREIRQSIREENSKNQPNHTVKENEKIDEDSKMQ